MQIAVDGTDAELVMHMLTALIERQVNTVAFGDRFLLGQAREHVRDRMFIVGIQQFLVEPGLFVDLGIDDHGIELVAQFRIAQGAAAEIRGDCEFIEDLGCRDGLARFVIGPELRAEESLGQPGDFRETPEDRDKLVFRISGEDLIEQLRHLDGALGVIAEDIALAPERLGLRCGIVVLFEKPVPDLVRPFELGLEVGIEIVAHVFREFPDVPVVPVVRDRKPGIAACLVGQLNQNLDGYAVDGPACIIDLRAVGPGHGFSVTIDLIGLHPANDAQLAGIRDQLEPFRIEQRAGLVQLDIFFAHDRDIARQIGAVLALGHQHLQGCRSGDLEDDLAVFLRDNIDFLADEGQLAPAFPGRNIGAEPALGLRPVLAPVPDRPHGTGSVRQFGRPAIIVQNGRIQICHLERPVRPRKHLARHVHDVDEWHADSVVGHVIQIESERWIAQSGIAVRLTQ